MIQDALAALLRPGGPPPYPEAAQMSEQKKAYRPCPPSGLPPHHESAQMGDQKKGLSPFAATLDRRPWRAAEGKGGESPPSPGPLSGRDRGEGYQAADAAGGYVRPGVPEPALRPAELAARDIDFKDRDAFDSPPVAFNGVNRRPRFLACGVKPDGGEPALGLRGEQPAAVDAGEVAKGVCVAQRHGWFLLTWGTGRAMACPEPRLLQPAGGDERRQAVRVLAVPVVQEALALAGPRATVDVDVVRRILDGQADPLDLEPSAEVGRDRGQEVVSVVLADRDADDAEPAVFGPYFAPDAPLRLEAGFAALSPRGGDNSESEQSSKRLWQQAV
jgi:hypothetical protein